MPKTVTITVGKDGKRTIEADGYTGEACKSATAFYAKLIKLLKESSEELKPEFYQAPEQSTEQEMR